MKFESIIILKENVENDEKEKLLNEIKKFMKEPTIEEWGIKKMAYPVKGHEKGYYIIFNFKAEHTDIEQLEDFYKKENNIIKYITVLNS